MVTVWKVQKWRNKTKDRLVKGFGGQCNKCGYKTTFKALDFHHINPTTKKFTISAALKSPRAFEEILEEAKKCALLCCRCHVELHANIWKIEDINVNTYVAPFEYEKQEKILDGICEICSKPIPLYRVCCSLECAAKKRIKVKWPSIDELKRMIKESSKSEVARRLGISEAAIRKRFSKYNRLQEYIQG